MRTDHETPLTCKYWEQLGEGILYKEFGIVQAEAGTQARRVDGVVVLGAPPRIASDDERQHLSLDGEDVIVIQTKATLLNPYVFGQALLSMDLITMRWAPRSLRSVLICAADDPELRPIIEDFPNLEICVEPVSQLQRFRLGRLDRAAAIAASRLGGAVVAPAQLSSRLRIDGVLVPSACDVHHHLLADLVAGRDVTSVHSWVAKRKLANVGMWIAGEVIIAQELLTRMGAASASSVIVGNHDGAIEAALRHHVEFDVMQAGSSQSAGANTTP